jgi:mitogen-activated protein kinase kinase
MREQAIVDGEPPDLPADRYSEQAIDFVRGCLNKIAKMRPTYAMLLRHAWVAPMMKPPTISEDEEAEKAAEAGSDLSSGSIDGVPSTEDKEVAEWAKSALEKKRQGKMVVPKKPALHEAPLDAVPGSPLMTKGEAPASVGEANVAAEGPIKPNLGVRISSPELTKAHVESVDFASDIAKDEAGT